MFKVSRAVLLLVRSVASWARLAGLAFACIASTTASAEEDAFPKDASRVEVLRWLAHASDLAPESVVIVTDDLVVAIAERADGQGADRSSRLTLREEVIDPGAATTLGGRSIQLVLDVDCPGHRLIVGARRIYERPNLQGPVRITRTDNAWVQTPADTVIDEVARAACSPQPPVPLLDAQLAPKEIRKDLPADRSAPAGAGPRSAEFAVQISAAASEDLARGAWRSLKAKLPDLIGPHAFTVEPVSAKGHTLYRALLLGFASPSEAAAMCRTLRSRSVDCLPRQMR